MARFSYIARNASGEIVRGHVDADHHAAARAALTSTGLRVEHLEEQEALTLSSSDAQKSRHSYHRFTDTLRLYAGWLVAWYFLIYALGTYQRVKPLPFHSAFLEGLVSSKLVLSFALAAFLFLLLSSIHRALGRGGLLGTALAMVGIGLFLVVIANA